MFVNSNFNSMRAIKGVLVLVVFDITWKVLSKQIKRYSKKFVETALHKLCTASFKISDFAHLKLLIIFYNFYVFTDLKSSKRRFEMRFLGKYYLGCGNN